MTVATMTALSEYNNAVIAFQEGFCEYHHVVAAHKRYKAARRNATR